MNLNSEYWNTRYQNQNTPWDADGITTPLKEYFDQIEDKSIKILIPGAGNAHEAAYLFQKGFKNVWVCDWAKRAIDNFKVQNPSFPESQLICTNFFELEQEFDLIVEQTFFCAIHPQLRPNYAQKVAQLLLQKGKLVGLLFAQNFEKEGPPFGGTAAEYRTYFEPYFQIKVLQQCYNSIEPRKGKELFFLSQKITNN